MSRRADLAAVARLLRVEGLDRFAIASRLGISYGYVNTLLRDPEGLEAKRHYWSKRTPLQKATSRMKPVT